MEQHQPRIAERERRPGFRGADHESAIRNACDGVRNSYLLLTVLSAVTVFAAANPLPLDDTFAEHARNAKAAIAANNVPVAKQELQAMLSIDPDNVDAHANLGMVEFLQGEYREASSHFEAVLSRSPSLTSARTFLGMCELRLGKTEHGRKMIEESLAKVADRRLHVQAALELVRSYTESGMLAKAESTL